MLVAAHDTTYALADPHGCLDVLERALSAVDLTGDAHLYLLGDYIPHARVDMDEAEYAARAAESLAYVRAFAEAHRNKVTVLPGNHELMLIELADSGVLQIKRDLLRWLRSLPVYVETERQIFVHAGVDEEAGDFWPWAREDWYFCGKFPPSFGAFEKDIIAGHVGPVKLVGGFVYEGVFWDGQSHYYLDATTEVSGRMNLLMYDARSGAYSQRIATADGVSDVMPVEDSGYLIQR